MSRAIDGLKPKRVPKTVGLHAHACANPKCRTRYEDVCEEHKTNRLCSKCRLGRHGWPELVANREPKDCCRVASRLATKDERRRFKLVGDTLWWICRICARTQGFEPTQREMA